jgi:hypothetical protein
MNSYVVKMFDKRKRVDQFITVGVVVWRDDECGTVVKENNSDRWSFDDMVHWLGTRQNRDTIEWWGESSRLR